MALISTLKKVNLSRCSIGDKGVAYLIKTGIDDLDVSYCGITEKGAKLLQENLDKYKSLCIIGNPNISDKTLVQIRSKFVKDPLIYTPIGIDLGLNTHSQSEQSDYDYKEKKLTVEVFSTPEYRNKT